MVHYDMHFRVYVVHNGFLENTCSLSFVFGCRNVPMLQSKLLSISVSEKCIVVLLSLSLALLLMITPSAIVFTSVLLVSELLQVG